MVHEMAAPGAWIILPFCALLGAIALGPLAFPNLWSRHYPKVSFALAAITLFYYLAVLQAGWRVLHVAHEYVSFILLIGSLFVVSGGIHIGIKGEATPRVNTLFLLCGALLANLLGTTGASMLLIRPWIRMNKYRITAHHVVFFIFIVSNVGGCLTPIGDPPLFLGFLKGIPFWWVAEHCWPMWTMAVGLLLALFYLLDVLNYRRAPKQVRREMAEPPDQWQISGLRNLLWLALILGAVFISNPPLLRETIMAIAATGSYFTTPRQIHERNHFNFHPIQEVAILFAGIFCTMIPALDWLQLNADRWANPSPMVLYWATGGLSSFLDNAPTYLSFLSALFGMFAKPEFVEVLGGLVQAQGAGLNSLTGPGADSIRQAYAALQQYYPAELASGSVRTDHLQAAFLLGNPKPTLYLVAISVAAVFFGANTYIGNGPNFLVKSISDQQKVNTPDFLNYIFRYALPLLLPVLVLVAWAFFRS